MTFWSCPVQDEELGSMTLVGPFLRDILLFYEFVIIALCTHMICNLLLLLLLWEMERLFAIL